MPIAKDHVVVVNFTVTDDADDSLLETVNSLAYLHGHDNLPAKIEALFDGLDTGAAVDAVVEGAFGDKTGNVVSVKKSELPRAQRDRLEVGTNFWSPSANAVLWVQATRGARITATPDHPYGGKTVRIVGTVADVRAASPEELAHGHAHGPGGHHH